MDESADLSDAGLTIRCFYSCPLCGLKKAAVEVQARGSEDVVAWMDATIRTIAADHRRRSPLCRPVQLHDLMIPIHGSEKIGGPSVS